MKGYRYLLLSWLVFVSFANGGEFTFSAEGAAKDPDTRKLFYTEKHFVVVDEQGRVQKRKVLYEDADGKVFAQKLNVTSGSVWAPAFELEDHRTGYAESLSWEDGTFVLRLKEAQGSPWKVKRITAEEGRWVADAGFDAFIRDNFVRLQEGSTIDFMFLSPARLSAIPFSVLATESTDTTLELKMILQNSLLRLLVDPIILVYEKQSQRLLSFEGITNIVQESGKNYEALISYSYPQ